MGNMLSLSLRPRRFDDIIGQKYTVKGLKNLSKTMAFKNIILLEGQSGTGKTTTALLIAQLLNCHSPKKEEDGSYSPCQECESCKDVINEKYSRDISVIDCNEMGKDDILALKQKISYAATFDKNKIIILDEAQELGSDKTKSSLLLLLEKTYKNVYFILTTMNVKKIDKSIISRTSPYKFKEIESGDIVDYLFAYVKNNKISVPTEFISEGIFTLADVCEGSIRLTLQYFERCLESEIYTSQDIANEFGFISIKDNFKMIYSLIKKDKDFFNDFEKLDKDKQEFFYNMSWKYIIEALSYFYTGNCNNDYKKGYFNSMKNDLGMDKIIEVNNIYNKVFEASNWFNAKYFSSKLLEYFSRKERRVREEV